LAILDCGLSIVDFWMRTIKKLAFIAGLTIYWQFMAGNGFFDTDYGPGKIGNPPANELLSPPFGGHHHTEAEKQ